MTTPVAIGTGSAAADTSRLASKENLQEAAEKFEAIFVGMMLKSMRATKLSSGLFDSSATEQFRDMQDQKLARSMAADAPLGLGQALADFLSQNRPDLKVSATPAVQSDMTGGTA